MNEWIKSIGRAKSPTPPNTTKRNIPTNDKVAIMKITKLTSISSSISLHDYDSFEEADEIGESDEVHVFIFLVQAVTGISALEKNTYKIYTHIQITTNVHPDSYAAVQSLFEVVSSSSVS